MVQHEIGKMKKLIDLNGDSVNFNINFTVTSLDGSEFYLLVIDQTTLDNNPDFEYRKVQGTISGNVLSDKNIYQNHYLILKADQPTVVDVIINKQDLPQNVLDRMNQPEQQKQEPRLQNQNQSTTTSTQENKSKIWIFVVLIILALALYLMLSKNGSLPVPNDSLLARLNNLEF